MPIGTKARTVSRLVRVLVDPNPEYVSLVNHGANQTPFRSVKVADFTDSGENDMSNARKRTLDPAAVKKTAGASNGKVAVVRAVRFAQSNFSDEASVIKYLKAHDYDVDTLTISETKKGFEAVSKVEDEYTNERTMKLGNGVELVVAQVDEIAATKAAPASGEAENDEGNTDAEAAQKAAGEEEQAASDESANQFAEVIQKYNDWIASYSTSMSLDEVMAAGADGLPPGIYEVNSAFYTALRNALIARDVAAVRTLASDFGEMVIKLAETFDAATVPGEVIERCARSLETEAAEEETETKEGEDTPTEKADGEATGGEEQNDGAGAGEGEDTTQKSDTDGEESAIRSMQASLDTLLASVAQGNEASMKASAALQEQVADIVERVSALEEVRQTRQSADEVDSSSAALEADASQRGHRTVRGSEDKLRRNTLGFISGGR